MENWIVPKTKSYTWSNLDRKYTNWSDKQWPFAIKFFNRNGKLNKNYTLYYINKSLKKSLNKLPFNL